MDPWLYGAGAVGILLAAIIVVAVVRRRRQADANVREGGRPSLSAPWDALGPAALVGRRLVGSHTVETPFPSIDAPD